MDKDLEKVSYITRKQLESAFGEFEGYFPFTPLKKDVFLNVTSANNEILYDIRKNLEEDVDRKQLISYVVIRSKENILGYTRLSGGGEKRLHDKASIGIGGHMNDTTASNAEELLEWLHQEAKRELLEEVKLPLEFNDDNLKLTGLINCEQTDVDKVHLGLVFQYYLEDDNLINIEANEKDTIQLMLMPINYNTLDRYEWVTKQLHQI